MILWTRFTNGHWNLDIKIPKVLRDSADYYGTPMNQNPMTTAKINRAIKKYNLEIVHERGSGYSYFLDLTTGYQVGDSIQVCYLHQQTLEEWVSNASWVRIVHMEKRQDIHPVCKI